MVTIMRDTSIDWQSAINFVNCITHILNPGPSLKDELGDASERAAAKASNRPIVIPADVKFNAATTCCTYTDKW